MNIKATLMIDGESVARGVYETIGDSIKVLWFRLDTNTPDGSSVILPIVHRDIRIRLDFDPNLTLPPDSDTIEPAYCPTVDDHIDRMRQEGDRSF